jgi:hypothetical protein
VATVKWLFIATLFLHAVAITITWSTTVVRRWAQHAWTSFVGPRGYLVFITLIAAYTGLYSTLEARHERQANRALFERSTFMTMVSSGSRASFIAAMKMFGPVQTMRVPRDPDLFAPSTWVGQQMPNKDPLFYWAIYFLPLCTAETCGDPDMTPQPLRINLIQADLSKANLSGAALSGANLSGADLSGADLSGANLSGAALSGADLSGADLSGADLGWADLSGADLSMANLSGAYLRGAKLSRADLSEANLSMVYLSWADLKDSLNLTQTQLDSACVYGSTELPDHLTHPAVCQRDIP